MSKQFLFGFIGCGNMGGALAVAAAKGNADAAFAVCDAMPEKAKALADAFESVRVASLAELAQGSRYIFIGVKPQMLETLFADLSPLLPDDAILVSMAAGTPIARIEALAGKALPVIRIMPNIAVSVGKGVILYDANEKVSGEDLSFFVSAMSGAGLLDRIEESKIDAASAVSGCGPAFAYLFVEALADGGVACGLPRDKAQTYAAAMLAGAAEHVLLSGRHPGALKDAVCSPGGTTIAGVRALEEGAFRAAAMDAVIAAYEKTLKL